MDDLPEQSSKSRKRYIYVLIGLVTVLFFGFILWQKWAMDRARKEQEASRLKRTQQTLERALWQKFKIGKAFISLPEDWRVLRYNLLSLKAGSPDFVESSPLGKNGSGSISSGLGLVATTIRNEELLKGDPDAPFINITSAEKRAVNDISFSLYSNDFTGLVNISYLYARTTDETFTYNFQLWFLTENKEEAQKLFEQILASFEYEVT